MSPYIFGGGGTCCKSGAILLVKHINANRKKCRLQTLHYNGGRDRMLHANKRLTLHKSYHLLLGIQHLPQSPFSGSVIPPPWQIKHLLQLLRYGNKALMPLMCALLMWRGNVFTERLHCLASPLSLLCHS